MTWYSILPRLLSEDRQASGTERDGLSRQHQLLKDRIFDVYRAIISFQVHVVCSQRPAALNTAGGIEIEYDKTVKVTVTSIMDAEKALASFNS